MKHIHDIDCLDFFLVFLGPKMKAHMVGICEITNEPVIAYEVKHGRTYSL